jgi:hypothetical protein
MINSQGKSKVMNITMNDMKDLQPGLYQHYKGKLYEVIDVVRHSETLEEMVLYKALYETEFGKETLWVRPKKMFMEEVELNGTKVKRFRRMESKV